MNVAGNKSISREENNKNIYCINSTNDVLWQIEPPETKFNTDSFVSIKLIDDELIAKRFSGFKYQIDMETGNAKVVGWDK